MPSFQCRTEWRLDQDSRCATVLECSSERSCLVSRPCHDKIATAQPIFEGGIIWRTTTEQGSAGSRLNGQPSIDETTFVKKFRCLIMSTEEKLVSRETCLEAADGRHSQQEVSEPSGMHDDDRAGHAGVRKENRLLACHGSIGRPQDQTVY